MRNPNPLRKALPLAACALTLFASSALRAASGDSGARNGDNRPELAYDPKALEQIKSGFNLDFLQLRKDQVDQRRQEIMGQLSDFYRDGTLARMKQFIESSYGVQLFHYMNPPEAGAKTWPEDFLPQKKGKKLDPAQEKAYQDAIVQHKREVDELKRTDGIVRYYMDYNLGGSFFEHAPSRSIPFKGVIPSRMAALVPKQVTGAEKPCDDTVKHSKCGTYDNNWGYRETPFVFSTLMFTQHETFGTWRLNGITASSAVFSTTGNPLYEAPALRSFTVAMSAMGLKALDATLVFLSGDMKTDHDVMIPYTVVYPQNDPTAPVPRPVVFISLDATDDDMQAMLAEHAPQIYAYNQLFKAGMLPSLNELDSELKKFKAELPEVAALLDKVNADNARNAMHATYLKITYALLSGVLAPAEFVGRAAVGFVGAPLSVGAMLSHPVLRQIFADSIDQDEHAHGKEKRR